MRRPENESELNKLDRVLVTRLDVLAAESIQAAVKQGMDRFGNIDVLLNNAGFGVFGPLEATPLEKIREQFETNIVGLAGDHQSSFAYLSGQTRRHDHKRIFNGRKNRVSTQLALQRHKIRFGRDLGSFELRDGGNRREG
jgi:NAD(P)-dependent dehydrogenase (short-subunit alcohol dehydrogenase family)